MFQRLGWPILKRLWWYGWFVYGIYYATRFIGLPELGLLSMLVVFVTWVVMPTAAWIKEYRRSH